MVELVGVLPGEVVEPADGVDIFFNRTFFEDVVTKVEHGETIVDEDGFRKELQVTVGEIS